MMSIFLRLSVIMAGFVIVNFELTPRLATMRMDLTEQQLYTLSPGTRQIIHALTGPTDLYFYFSHKAAKDLLVMRSYATRVESLLREYERASNGLLRLHIVDPEPFSANETRAVELDLQAVPIGKGGTPVYFGLAIVDAEGEHARISFLALEQQAFLEYDISRMLQGLSRIKRPTIGLMSSLPLAGGFDVQTGQNRQPWRIMDEIGKLFHVHELAQDVGEIPSELKVLMLVHPKRLPLATLRGIDQFVLRGGRLLVFVDPYSEQDRGDNYFGIPSKDKSSDLAPLFKAWGIKLLRSDVLGDSQYGQYVSLASGAEPIWQPTALSLTSSAINPQDPITAGIDNFNLSTAGILTAVPGASTTLTPLLHSSTQAMPYKTARLDHLEDPKELAKAFKATGERYLIAVHLEGPAHSAFPHPPEAIADTKHINVVVVADTDLLSDNLWTDVQWQGGRQVWVPWADNGVFVLNALDSLSGSDALISLRSRGHYSRTFTVVEDMQQQARQRYQEMSQNLRGRLDENEIRLSTLVAGQNSDISLTPEQQANLEKFTAEKLAIQKEMRHVAREINVQVEQLGEWIKLANIVLIPCVLTVLLLSAVVWRRSIGKGRCPSSD
jgi:ABC-type uncharacterized transport system involved in gliding motility auxiliary subunit